VTALRIAGAVLAGFVRGAVFACWDVLDRVL
jgi:hypothetical protein